MKKTVILFFVLSFFVTLGNAEQEISKGSSPFKRKLQEQKDAQLKRNLLEISETESQVPMQGNISIGESNEYTVANPQNTYSKSQLRKTLRKALSNSADQLEECDLIILKSGEEIKCKVLEIGSSEIKYKKCDNIDGPTYSIIKMDVLVVKYVNGTSEIVNKDNASVSNGQQSNGPKKSQVVALILAILVGGLGIHRFYLGHVGMGLLYLFTAGLCGIGTIIDIVRIAIGALKPKNGDYTSKL
jgi:TM2 domain-containing membrane protein YozV